MGLIRERTDLDKKPTWYLFILCNLVVLIGCAVTWGMAARGHDLNRLFVPTLVCNLMAIALCALFVYLEIKAIMPKQMHFQKKWLYFYLVALILFLAAILFNAIFYIIAIKDSKDALKSHSWQLIVHFAVTGGLTLVSIGFQRYARFKIDLDILRRKHGEEIKDKTSPKKEPKKENPIKPSDGAKASGGLLEQMK